MRKKNKINRSIYIHLTISVIFLAGEVKSQSLPPIVQSSAWCFAALVTGADRSLPEPQSHGLTGQQIMNHYLKYISPYQNTHELHALGERAGKHYRTLDKNELIMIIQGCIDHVAFSNGITW
jgi:hypothetical protein